MDKAQHRIGAIDLDERSILRRNRDVEHERRVAIFDLLQENFFRLTGNDMGGNDMGGPYHLTLGIEDNRLIFTIRTMTAEPLRTVMLALTPFRKIVKDYFAICDSYYEAIKAGSLARIEAIDMGRRGVHNEGSVLLQARLEGKIEMDMETARRLFTLVCVLHIR